MSRYRPADGQAGTGHASAVQCGSPARLAARGAGMRQLPHRARQEGIPAPGKTGPRGVRLVPHRRAGAVRSEPPRQGCGARRQARAGLRDLPRNAQYSAAVGPARAHLGDGNPQALRGLPSRGHAGEPDARHSPDQHPGQLHGQHPWPGAFRERSYRRRGLHKLPHGAFRAAAHRPALLHRQGQHRQDLHQVPRADRNRAPQSDPRRAVGEGTEPHSGLRGLPRAAQGAQGLLLGGHVGPRLPAMPWRPEPESHARRKDGFAVRQRGGAGRIAARGQSLRSVPHRRHAIAQPVLRYHAREGGLLHLPRRPGESVSRKHARPTGGAGEPGRARLPGLP